jgi:hypothetical protein
MRMLLSATCLCTRRRPEEKWLRETDYNPSESGLCRKHLLIRFGLLWLVAGFVFGEFLESFPLTTQGSAWYAGISLAGILLMAAMAFYVAFSQATVRPASLPSAVATSHLGSVCKSFRWTVTRFVKRR